MSIEAGSTAVNNVAGRPLGIEYHRWIAGLALAMLCAGCSQSKDDNPPIPSASPVDVERSLSLSPTNAQSFELMSADVQTRFATVRALFQQSGNPCGAVTRATFEGGLDGTDEWRVICTESGAWQMWLNFDGRIDFQHCKDSRCR
jgi:hypothetical protein